MKILFFSRIWPFARTSKRYLLLGFLLMCLGTLISLLPAYLTIGLTNDVLVPLQGNIAVPSKIIYLYLSGFLIASISTWILSWAKTYILACASEQITKNIRTMTFNHVLNLSLDFYNHRRTGDLIARIGQDTDRLNLFIAVDLMIFVQDAVMLLMILALILSINLKLGLYTALPLPIILLLIFSLKNQLNFCFEQCNRIWSQVMNSLTEVIHGIRLVKCFAQEELEICDFEKINDKNLKINNHMNKIWAFFAPTSTFIMDLGILIIWAVGINMMLSHVISLGVLLGFIAYSTKLYGRLESLSGFVEQYKKSGVYLKRIYELLDRKSTIIESQHPVHLEHIAGRIDIRDVNFFYDDKQVLFNINLSILPGEKVGFVGLSGAGKSTLMNLICRFYDPQSGSICLDGIDIKDINLKEYRNYLGTVLQESYIFYGTIAENIAYACPNASFTEIVAAAKQANAHAFILSQPLGYDTLIQENGTSLSGGEKQRIAIARTILSNPVVLLLDEPTSAVDVVTEEQIQHALHNLTKDKTTIIISHRLSLLQTYDKLVVIERGQIVEVGTHHELINNKSYYYNFYQLHLRLHQDQLS